MTSDIKLIEVSALSDFLALRHIRVAPEQRAFAKFIWLTYLQTRHPAVTTFRIDHRGEAIGYVMLIHAEKPTQWIIERLTIDREHQRQGHARAVADQLIDMVYGFDNSEMVIARYEPENEAARELFLGLNFVEQDDLFRGRLIAVLEFEFEDEDEPENDDDAAEPAEYDEDYDDDEAYDDDEDDDDDKK